jgi:hypothetical protein
MKAQLKLIAFSFSMLIYAHRGISQSYATGIGTVADFGYSFHAGK